jgi:hypothetical protein
VCGGMLGTMAGWIVFSGMGFGWLGTGERMGWLTGRIGGRKGAAETSVIILSNGRKSTKYVRLYFSWLKAYPFFYLPGGL